MAETDLHSVSIAAAVVDITTRGGGVVPTLQPTVIAIYPLIADRRRL